MAWVPERFDSIGLQEEQVRCTPRGPSKATVVHLTLGQVPGDEAEEAADEITQMLLAAVLVVTAPEVGFQALWRLTFHPGPCSGGHPASVRCAATQLCSHPARPAPGFLRDSVRCLRLPLR